MNTDQEQTVQEKRAPSIALNEILEQLERESAPDDIIRQAIHFMREAISQAGTPRFKDFWEVRRLCLPFFKENLNPKVRALLWAEYIELSGEARRIKEILDEQSTFAAEQIELAIAGLEHDLEHFDQFLAGVSAMIIPESCGLSDDKKNAYASFQKELDLLNTLALRINSLRKEVVKTDMRVRYKNRFFNRLSAMGDRVFPRRKELIKRNSEEFAKDVNQFIKQNFEESGRKIPPLFVLREEIKALQSMAKELTLNTQAFTETRLHLSQSWDKIREFEKERKKEIAQKKQIPSPVKEPVKVPVKMQVKENKKEKERQEKEESLKKKEKTIMNLSAGDLETLEQLKLALQERKQQRQEIKEQLEQYRKALGGSGLDIEKSMSYGELVEAEKERLERANSAIQEIEEKIYELEG